MPTLPLLVNLVSWKTGLLAAVTGAMFFLVLAFAAKILSSIMNKNQIVILYFLAAAVCVYSINAWWDLPVFLVLSLCLLGPAVENKSKYKPTPQTIFLKAGIFFLLAVFLSAVQEILGGYLHLSIFQRISGSFLLLLIPALFWPASRKIKGKIRSGPVLAEAGA